jgi:hypothetical protein
MGPYQGSDPPFVPPQYAGFPQAPYGPYGQAPLPPYDGRAPPYDRGDADIKLAEDGKHLEEPFDASSTITLTSVDANQQADVYSEERRRQGEARV